MDARDILVGRALGVDAPKISAGVSSYFTTPTPDLDPSLFGYDSTRLLPAVRELILTTLAQHWGHRYRNPQAWSTVWIAGSGVTYQWSAARSPGDLDVLIGVDFTRFRRDNHEFAGFGEDEISSLLNEEFRTILSPTTAATTLGTSTYEVTWYVNPNSADIRNINPYAAYDVTHDRWSVEPISLPPDWDPETHFPAEWWSKIREESRQAKDILRRFLVARNKAASYNHGSPQWVNAATLLEQVVAEGAEMFNEIHNSRRNAFSQAGKGYLDWYNFRWQAHKRDGVVPALHELANLATEARQQANEALYGTALFDSHAALTAAARAHSILDGLTL